MKKRKKIKVSDIVLFLVTLIIAVIFAFPIFFNLMSAFKTNGEILRDAIAFPAAVYLDSFKYLLTETDYPKAIFNSAVLTVVSIALMVFIIPMAAYGIERTANKWTNGVYVYFLFGMMIPFQVYMIPLFRQMKAMGLFGTLAGPIMIYIAGSVGFGVLLYTSFLKGVPREIEESAEIDGCSRIGIFWKIVFPLLGPVTASMVVLQGLGIWNDFLLPMLVLPSGEPKTMIVELFYYVGEFSSRWDMIFAGTTMSLIPVLIAFLTLQKYFVKGVSSGAIKG
ncbi:L-arabinose transport system permease protein AraQ [Paenibacillus plantiphilus]|uniref:L-arabinose transport system permease protein AraQ n=1 Tax=Paenibacillus plantiphilus TaxID=2905650 RepID=A0ABM9CEF5_9BACL|nr:carbohydrate ABC transporter permease [Paenibacillus plantiphilus]CAH1209573.1 L-arabinose transport system permease protein AraQ [Paenibacillus plantiphilus]